MTLRAGNGFRFPNQKYDDSKALYVNFRYMQEYLNRIWANSKYGPTTIIGTSHSGNPSRNPESAHVICNGENDDVQISAALAAGGWVHLLDGTYIVGASINTTGAGDRFRLTGSGIGTTIITTNDAVNIFALSHGNASTIADTVSFEDFSVDGNSVALDGFSQGTSFRDCVFHNIHVYGCTEDGWSFTRTGSTSFYNQCYSYNNGRHGFSQGEGGCYIANSSASGNGSNGFNGYQQVDVCSITNSNFSNNTGAGIAGAGGVNGTSAGPLVSGCHIDNNGSHGIGWSFLPGTRQGPVVVGNRITNNGGTSVTSGSGVSIVVGNYIDGNGTDAPTVAAGSVVGLNAPLGNGADLDHGSLVGLSDDDHTQYVLRNILTTDGDLFVRSGGIVDRVGVGTDGQVLTADSAEPAKLKWADSTGGSGTSSNQEFRKIFLLGGM